VKIQIPFNFVPRSYQLGVLKAIDSGFKRIVCVWHRRAGKDKTFLNLMIKKMFERIGSYYYFFPTYNQGRKILWEGLDGDGFGFLKHFPQAILKKKPNDTEMKVELKNGSIFRIIGTEDIDSIVGTNPIGCVFSEYALQDPRGWDYIRPILAENGGFAIFNFTPRGENHGYDIYNLAMTSSDWYCELKTVDDTGAISREVLETERKEIIKKYGDDALYQQEYYCNFKIPIAGSYYVSQITQAQKEGRITQLAYDSSIPVNTYWDLGVDDSTSIWFVQNLGNRINCIDYYESSGKGLIDYIKILKEKNYLYGYHVAPHDIKQREFVTGKSRLDLAESHGINFDVAAKLSIDDGIDRVRTIFSRCYFDSEKCKRGLLALKSYHKDYDEKNKCYKKSPKHDWSSHGADAFRTLAVGFIEQEEKRENEVLRARTRVRNTANRTTNY